MTVEYFINETNNVQRKFKTDGGSEIVERMGSVDRIILSPVEVTAVLNETVCLSLKWMIFDTSVNNWVENPAKQDDFILNVAGTEAVIPANVKEITFSSAEPGVYVIESHNRDTDNGKASVIINE